MKQLLFSLHIQDGAPLRNHLEQVNAILLDIRNIDVKVHDDDAALILLVSLPHENFVDSFIVGKDSYRHDFISLCEISAYLTKSL